MKPFNNNARLSISYCILSKPMLKKLNFSCQVVLIIGNVLLKDVLICAYTIYLRLSFPVFIFKSTYLIQIINNEITNQFEEKRKREGGEKDGLSKSKEFNVGKGSEICLF